jgi:hypothetical protein
MKRIIYYRINLFLLHGSKVRFGLHLLWTDSVQDLAMHRDYTENSKQTFPEKDLRGLSPNFHIHMSVSDL